MANAVARLSQGGNWSTGFVANIATLFDVVNGDLFAFDSIPITLGFDGFDSTDFRALANVGAFSDSVCEASGNLQFYRGDKVVTFDGCAGPESTSPYTLTRVPEPEPLVLALAAGAAAWITRRRRTR